MQLISHQDGALFLDFDGTLVDFAPIPEAVVVSEDLRCVLQDLWLAFDGAVALVSGRSIDSLDQLLRLPQLPVAGGHGAEWRLPGGERNSLDLTNPEFTQAVDLIEAYARDRGLLLENKAHSLALHFRDNPVLQPEIDHFLADHVADFTNLRVIYGNCVREVQPVGVDKGLAVARFMQEPPFRGRRPCYIGDDTTDEDAFAWVNEEAGVSIKVGDGASCAAQRLEDTQAVSIFLRSLLRS